MRISDIILKKIRRLDLEPAETSNPGARNEDAPILVRA